MTVIQDVLSALDDPTRRDLLDVLVRRGSATATLLSTELPVTRQAIVQHLGVLDRAQLVSSNRRGRERWYQVRTEGIIETAQWLDELASKWDRRLHAIKQIAEET